MSDAVAPCTVRSDGVPGPVVAVTSTALMMGFCTRCTNARFNVPSVTVTLKVFSSAAYPPTSANTSTSGKKVRPSAATWNRRTPGANAPPQSSANITRTRYVPLGTGRT